MKNITEVRRKSIEGYPGFRFETPSDVYRLKFASWERGVFSRKKKFDETPLDQAVTIIEDNKGGVKFSKEDSDSGMNLADELERLADLVDDGVLSEKEFEKAKDKLLSEE